MKIRNQEIFEIHAAYCRTLASPARLMIMACLDLREMSVGELAEVLDAALPTVSRHLGVLKAMDLVTSRHEGNKVFYRIVDTRIPEACRLIRSILVDQMKKRGQIIQEFNADEIIVED